LAAPARRAGAAIPLFALRKPLASKRQSVSEDGGKFYVAAARLGGRRPHAQAAASPHRGLAAAQKETL